MPKQHVKKGDEVVVLAGTERGKRGRVIEVVKGKQRVIVEGIKKQARQRGIGASTLLRMMTIDNFYRAA